MENVKKNTSKKLNISLWTAQAILAIIFLLSGVMKLTQPIEQLAGSLPWVTDVPGGVVRFIGFSELLGALGLLLPSLLRIKPVLTAWAAIGIILVMLFALIFHLTRGEVSAIASNLIFAIIAAFVAWGRLKKLPIQGK